jgi:hypothetical protein
MDDRMVSAIVLVGLSGRFRSYGVLTFGRGLSCWRLNCLGQTGDVGWHERASQCSPGKVATRLIAEVSQHL